MSKVGEGYEPPRYEPVAEDETLARALADAGQRIAELEADNLRLRRVEARLHALLFELQGVIGAANLDERSE